MGQMVNHTVTQHAAWARTTGHEALRLGGGEQSRASLTQRLALGILPEASCVRRKKRLQGKTRRKKRKGVRERVGTVHQEHRQLRGHLCTDPTPRAALPNRALRAPQNKTARPEIPPAETCPEGMSTSHWSIFRPQSQGSLLAFSLPAHPQG